MQRNSTEKIEIKESTVIKRLAHTLTVPKNTRSYWTGHTTIIVLVNNIQRFM